MVCHFIQISEGLASIRLRVEFAQFGQYWSHTRVQFHRASQWLGSGKTMRVSGTKSLGKAERDLKYPGRSVMQPIGTITLSDIPLWLDGAVLPPGYGLFCEKVLLSCRHKHVTLLRLRGPLNLLWVCPWFRCARWEVVTILVRSTLGQPRWHKTEIIAAEIR